MSIDGDMCERHGRVLAELAEAGLAMVRRLSQAMEQADDAQTLAHVGLAFHRVSRAVRQTMALEFRLVREARREPVVPSPRPTQPTPTSPRERPERADWNEYERRDTDEALDGIDALLEGDDLDAETLHDALEAAISGIRRDIAADPILVKAGILAPALQAVKAPRETRSRRSALLGAAAFAPSPLAAIKPASPKPSLWRSSA